MIYIKMQDDGDKIVRTFKKGDKVTVISKKPLRHTDKAKRKNFKNSIPGTVKSAIINNNMLFYNVLFDSPTINHNKKITNEYRSSKITELKSIKSRSLINC